MLYALTHRLPRTLRNEIACTIEQAVRDNHKDALRHCPGIVYVCDAEPGQE